MQSNSSEAQERLDKILAKVEEEGNQKIFFYKGYKCLIKRTMDSGHLCGYVGLDENSRFYEKNYEEVYEKIKCHGGITFADFWDNLQDQKYYLGFDCAHAFDLRPFVYTRYPQIFKPDDITALQETYKDMEYVEKEIQDVVDQIIQLEGEGEEKEDETGK